MTMTNASTNGIGNLPANPPQDATAALVSGGLIFRPGSYLLTVLGGVPVPQASWPGHPGRTTGVIVFAYRRGVLVPAGSLRAQGWRGAAVSTLPKGMIEVWQGWQPVLDTSGTTGLGNPYQQPPYPFTLSADQEEGLAVPGIGTGAVFGCVCQVNSPGASVSIQNAPGNS